MRESAYRLLCDRFLWRIDMKAFFILLAVTCFSGTSALAKNFTPAKILNVQILKSNPVQYSISYQKTCDDMDVRAVKVISGKDLLLGVLVFRAPNQRPCDLR